LSGSADYFLYEWEANTNKTDLEDIKGNKSVIKALDILDYLGETKEPAHLKELAIALNLPESTVHRLLTSLLSKHFVQQSDYDHRYNLGWKFITLANSLGIYGQLPQLLRFHLKTLANDVKQSINLSILVGKNVIYLDSINPTDKVSMYSPPGTIVPAYASSMGKAQLAFLSNETITRLFPDQSLERFTNNTITSREVFITQIEDVRKQGFALDRGEYDSNIQCIGAPILDSQGMVIAGISISVFSLEIPPDWYKDYVSTLLETCKKISNELCA
jgi:IclR family KDG regulon transcriptional repressor